jgi:SAM-dependent methyltransferase
MNETSLVDFYRRHGISPVRQDISNLEVHFARRAALYRQLGLLPSFLQGRSVLEIGPGSGFNSVYTASLRPARYVLVEANPTGVADIETLFEHFPDLRAGIEIVSQQVEAYGTAERFDFVICEGMLALAGVPRPEELLRRVSGFAAPRGVLVITCIDAISDFAETLRRLFAQLLIRRGEPDWSLDTQAARLVPIFGPHLSTLTGMSRRQDDWVIDNLLNPASIGPCLSIPDAIATLDESFELFGSSPHYHTDWRWYKSLTAETTSYNERGIVQYWENVHNLIDYRSLSAPREAAANKRLYAECDGIRAIVRDYEATHADAVVASIRPRLRELRDLVGAFSAETANAVQDAESLLSSVPPSGEAIASSRGFAPWFGRGQQYLSFSRKQ